MRAMQETAPLRLRQRQRRRRATDIASAAILLVLSPLCESFVISSKALTPTSSCLPFRHQPVRLEGENPSYHGRGRVGRHPPRRGPVPLSAGGDGSGDDDDILNIESDIEDGNNDDDDDDDFAPPAASFSEQSQLLGFISDYLRKEQGNQPDTSDGAEAVVSSVTPQKEATSGSGEDDSSDSSAANVILEPNIAGPDDDYLIAIPLDACHELGLELESVQRAILYHCPVLVHACIPMAATRLPLLYVTAPSNSPPAAASALRSVVQRAVRRVIFDEANQSEGDDDDETEDDDMGVRRDDGRPDVEGVNADGIRPILIPFSTLEIDGDNNQVLCTVGDGTSSGARTVAKLVKELRADIEASLPGWKVRLPDDPAATAGASAAAPGAAVGTSKFRLRVPFVRLPPNWNDYLDPSKDYHTSDEGGNGISPILWGQWMDDDFGDAVRMREVAIYPRRQRLPQTRQVDLQAPALMTEEAVFHVPDFVVALPEGNAELAKVEKKFATYQNERIRDAEARERQAAQDESSATATMGDATMQASLKPDPPLSDTPLDKYDALFTRTLDRLGSLYADDATETNVNETEAADGPAAAVPDDAVTRPNANEPPPPPAAAAAATANDDATYESPQDVEPSESTSEESRERMRRVVESRARIETERELLTKRKQDKPPIEENPVFAKYKDGTLVPSSSASRKSGGESSPPRALPPFPSNEHVVGFWRVVRSPTGFDVEEGDSSRSDNLVLRVDGTTAGGPILNKDTRQKASAGTWRLLPSSDSGSGTDDVQDGSKTANLRIRLVIPPQKQRILVMQGKLERVRMSGEDLPLAPRGTFGIPALEERAARATSVDQDTEDLVYCSGTVFMEDAVTGLNRDEIGTFTLQKLFTPTDPTQYTITIPRPVRNQD